MRRFAGTRKSYLKDLESTGIPVIPTHWLESGESFDLRGILDAHGWDTGFIKPRIGATARATFRFDPADGSLLDAQRHLAGLLETEAALVQPYLSSVEEVGERSAIFIDGVLTHAVEKIPAPGDYRVQDDFRRHRPTLRAEARRTGTGRGGDACFKQHLTGLASETFLHCTPG